MKAAAIIVAAGAGKRFGSRTPKQFLPFKGMPVFLWSVLAFRKVPAFEQIILVVPGTRLKRLAPYAKKYGLDMVPGGAERYDSVRAGIGLVRPDIEFIAIHDGARPLVTPALIAAGLEAAGEHGASVVAVPSRDTVKQRRAGDFVGATVPRQDVWLAQTPQTFHRSVITHAYEQDDLSGVTDDCQAVERLGYPVKLVQGEYTNMKITEPFDLAVAGMLADRKKKRK